MDHWCETCDRGFPSRQILENHMREHQKCKIDGCQFVAHPNVITKHIQMQHASGLFKKIANLNNPEDIKKWIEERKKKFPTKANIEKKIASIKEKVNRGEKLGLGHKREYKHDRDTRSTDKIKKNNFKNNNILGKGKNRNKHRKKELMLPEVEEKHTLKPFTGLKNLVDLDNAGQMDEEGCPNIEFEDDDNIDKTNGENKALICTALSALSNFYGSSDEENDISPPSNKAASKTPHTMHNSSNFTEKRNESQDKDFENGENSDDAPEEVKVVKHEGINEPITDKSEKHINNKKNIYISKKNNMIVKERQNSIHRAARNRKSKLPSTLLQKLLQNEIRQERNIVLQCIHYIKQNNYFETDKNT